MTACEHLVICISNQQQHTHATHKHRAYLASSATNIDEPRAHSWRMSRLDSSSQQCASECYHTVLNNWVSDHEMHTRIDIILCTMARCKLNTDHQSPTLSGPGLTRIRLTHCNSAPSAHRAVPDGWLAGCGYSQNGRCFFGECFVLRVQLFVRYNESAQAAARARLFKSCRLNKLYTQCERIYCPIYAYMWAGRSCLAAFVLPLGAAQRAHYMLTIHTVDVLHIAPARVCARVKAHSTFPCTRRYAAAVYGDYMHRGLFMRRIL